MFIGSSVEGKEIAESIQVNLDYDVYSTLWSQGVFGLSGGTLASLMKSLKNFDFATLVLTPDDMLLKRGKTFSAARDNVLFELGLFMGYLGPERTFIVHPRDKAIDLPTDLAGVTSATYESPTKSQSLEAALGATCTRIKRAISNAPPKSSSDEDSSSPTVYSDLREMRSIATNLISALSTKAADASSLALLAGSWKNIESKSTMYSRVVDGEVRVVYCYGGNDAATGTYFGLKRIGNELYGRFRWFESEISGFVWLRIEGNDLLAGGWWYAEDVDETVIGDPRNLKISKGMQQSTWQRRNHQTTAPWAEEWFTKKLWLSS